MSSLMEAADDEDSGMTSGFVARSSSQSEVPKSISYSKDYSKRGILAKKGMGKIYKPWSLRNIYVDLNQSLAYFDGTTLKGEIQLDGVTVRQLSPEEADGRQYAFEIGNISGVRRTKDNVLILAASSAQEAQEWIECLRAASSSTIRARTLNGPGYMSFATELKSAPVVQSSDMDNIRRLREIRQQQKEKKMQSVTYFGKYFIAGSTCYTNSFIIGIAVNVV